jgi:uncharacterized protein
VSLGARALLFLLGIYQSFFSALMPSACKFYPSCSHYATDAVRIHGARRGSWLALRRVARCHPFTRGGVDLVPDRVAEKSSNSVFPNPSDAGINSTRNPASVETPGEPGFSAKLDSSSSEAHL